MNYRPLRLHLGSKNLNTNRRYQTVVLLCNNTCIIYAIEKNSNISNINTENFARHSIWGEACDEDHVLKDACSIRINEQKIKKTRGERS